MIIIITIFTEASTLTISCTTPSRCPADWIAKIASHDRTRITHFTLHLDIIGTTAITGLMPRDFYDSARDFYDSAPTAPIRFIQYKDKEIRSVLILLYLFQGYLLSCCFGIQIFPRPKQVGRTAFAVRAGLIEMCLSLIERFGGHQAFGDKQSLFQYICSIFTLIHNIIINRNII